MNKRILILSFFLFLTGCASADESFSEESNPEIEDNEETSINSQSVNLLEEPSSESDFEKEDDQEVEEIIEVEPIRPWEEFEDINEFMAVRDEEKRFNIADAPELEEQVELAFQDEIPNDSHVVTARWSGFVFTFANQMTDYFSDEYIDKMHELNEAIGRYSFEYSTEDIQQLVQEAREIRESE